MIKVHRNMMMHAAKAVVTRMNIFTMFYLIGSMVSFYKTPSHYLMLIQAILSILVIGSFNFSLNYLQTHYIFKHLKLLKLTDWPSLIFCLYIFGYFVVYNSFSLFKDFQWLDLLFVLLNFSLCITIYSNSTAYNVIIGNLTYFFHQDEVEISEDEWNKFKFKYQIIE